MQKRQDTSCEEILALINLLGRAIGKMNLSSDFNFRPFSLDSLDEILREFPIPPKTYMDPNELLKLSFQVTFNRVKSVMILEDNSKTEIQALVSASTTKFLSDGLRASDAHSALIGAFFNTQEMNDLISAIHVLIKSNKDGKLLFSLAHLLMELKAISLCQSTTPGKVRDIFLSPIMHPLLETV
jgi:hypothetical protein